MSTGFTKLLGIAGNKALSKVIIGGLALFAGLSGAPAMANGLDISIGVGGEVSPGVYGRVDIGSARRSPAIIIDSPVIIHRPRRYVDPIYLHVPPGHARHWDKHCRKYGACDTPVYFVRSNEYRNFRPSYIEPRYIYRTETRIYGDDRRGGERYYGRDDRRHHRDDDRNHYREERRHERDYDKHHDRGHGNGRGHGRDD
jgi:hypothetical protein